jgi:hypothetical protein
MPSHDMSKTACIERAKHQKEHDTMKAEIAELKDEMKEAFMRLDTVLDLVLKTNPELRDTLKNLCDDPDVQEYIKELNAADNKGE